MLDDKPLISKELIDLSKWIKENYLSSYLDAIQLILPPGDFKRSNTFIETTDNKDYKNLTNDEIKIMDL